MLSPTLKDVWTDTLSLDSGAVGRPFQANSGSTEGDQEVREKRFQVELERERQRAEVYEGIIKGRLALEEKREARPQGLWELEKERLGLNAGRTGSE